MLVEVVYGAGEELLRLVFDRSICVSLCICMFVILLVFAHNSSQVLPRSALGWHFAPARPLHEDAWGP